MKAHLAGFTRVELNLVDESSVRRSEIRKVGYTFHPFDPRMRATHDLGLVRAEERGSRVLGFLAFVFRGPSDFESTLVGTPLLREGGRLGSFVVESEKDG